MLVRDGLDRCVEYVEDNGAFSGTQPSIASQNYVIFSYQFAFLWRLGQYKKLSFAFSIIDQGGRRDVSVSFSSWSTCRAREEEKELNCIDNAGVGVRKNSWYKLSFCKPNLWSHGWCSLLFSIEAWWIFLFAAIDNVFYTSKVSATYTLSLSLVDRFSPPTTASSSLRALSSTLV